jgi:chromosomal replication initiation ATPase DnaA
MILPSEVIVNVVLDYYNLEHWILKAKDRHPEFVNPRQVIAYFCKKYTRMSLVSISLIFGTYDHSNVIHAVRHVQNQYDTDRNYYYQIEEINIILKSKVDKIPIPYKEVYQENDYYNN